MMLTVWVSRDRPETSSLRMYNMCVSYRNSVLKQSDLATEGNVMSEYQESIRSRVGLDSWGLLMSR